MNEKAPTMASHWTATLSVALLIAAAGCGSGSTESAKAAFDNAEPFEPVLGLEDLSSLRASPGPYRLVSGDVVEIQLPAVAAGGLPRPFDKVEKCLCRVGTDGAINLPVAGPVEVDGKTLSEVEKLVIGAYHPRYVTSPPTVVAQVAEYACIRISVSGAVRQPGIYELRSNEKSLFVALMRAGGIIPEGTGAISIRRSSRNSQAAVLKAVGADGTIEDVSMEDGDAVDVERSAEAVLTVTGLVKRPGVFPYPPGARLSLAHAVALAGGVDDVISPQRARVYRRTAEGQVISASFGLDSAGMTESSGVELRPGDVVVLEHTVATQTRALLSHLLRVGAGVSASYSLN